jgi:hypothetical protein
LGASCWQTVAVPMREDCRHFQSRTYDDGEVARLCVLNLAPEAPWRCPENCPRYERDIIDATFVSGSLVRPEVEPEPDDSPEEVAGILDEADAIVTEAGPEILAEVEEERQGKKRRRFWQRKRGDDGDDGGDGGEFRLSSR